MKTLNSPNFLERRFLSTSIILFLLLFFFVALKSCRNFQVRLRTIWSNKRPDGQSLSTSDSESTMPPPPVVTLSFGTSSITPMIIHNCILLSRASVPFSIYTDDVLHPVCQLCTCIQFEKIGCECQSNKPKGCSYCEKLFFIANVMKTHGELVFLDNDLTILKQDFIPALVSRTRHFDFLAAYGFWDPASWRYSSSFNSGLMFMRRLSGLNYTELIDVRNRMGTNDDQSIISTFIRQHYRRWDTLSLRWHCRYLFKPAYDIDFSDCFTFHGQHAVLQRHVHNQNFSLLTIPTLT